MKPYDRETCLIKLLIILSRPILQTVEQLVGGLVTAVLLNLALASP